MSQSDKDSFETCREAADGYAYGNDVAPRPAFPTGAMPPPRIVLPSGGNGCDPAQGTNTSTPRVERTFSLFMNPLAEKLPENVSPASIDPNAGIAAAGPPSSGSWSNQANQPLLENNTEPSKDRGPLKKPPPLEIPNDPGTMKRMQNLKLLNAAKSFKEQVKVTRNRHRTIAALLILLVMASVAAIVAPICVKTGCGAKKSKNVPAADNTPPQLVVSFKDIATTVKQVLGPMVLQSIPDLEEVLLDKVGFRIVNVKDYATLDIVQGLLEAAPELSTLVRSRALPLVDPGWRPANITNAVNSLAAMTIGRRRWQLADISLFTKDNSVVNMTAVKAALNDTLAGQQWHLGKINVTGAWSVTQGSPNVVVAVIDTGCDLEHPDLKDSLWVNPREVRGNGADDDGNGYVDDVHGYDFVGKGAPQDTYGHGTHIAGIIAAAANNGIGVAGIAPKVKIMCLKVSGEDTSYKSGMIFEAFNYAIRMGAHIISCSFGPKDTTLAPQRTALATVLNETKFYGDAVAAAIKANVFVAAAAGNENFKLDTLLNATRDLTGKPATNWFNPCQLHLNRTELALNMMCVMSTSQTDTRWLDDFSPDGIAGSNYGSQSVHIAAPGRAIMSTFPMGLASRSVQGYEIKFGTSMATPMVAAVGALVASVLGESSGNYYQGAAIAKILRESARPLTTLSSDMRYAGRLDAAAAVRDAVNMVGNRTVMAPMANWSPSIQGTQIRGFMETYFTGAGTSTWPWQASSYNNVLDYSVRGGGTNRFDNFKYGAGTTLLINSTLYITKRGTYAVKVATNAPADDLDIRIGQKKLEGAGADAGNNKTWYMTAETPGYYLFQLYYRNPSQLVDIRFAPPDAPVNSFDYINNFFLATDPDTVTFTPRPAGGVNMALSQTWHVLYKNFTAKNATASATLAVSSALPYSATARYTYSTVLEDLNMARAKQVAMALPMPLDAPLDANSTRGVEGVAWTRISMPDTNKVFAITCQSCSVYVDGLLVIDLSPPAITPLAQAEATTRTSGCANLRLKPTYDITVIFRAADIDNALLWLRWQPCAAAAATAGNSAPIVATSLKPFIVNPMHWDPASGVAGYVGGMQCDLWAANDQAERFSEEPMFKFRLPAALAQAQAQAGNSTAVTASCLDSSSSSGGVTLSEGFSRSCASNMTFVPLSLFSGLQIDGIEYSMRCWTYLRRGFANGRVANAVRDITRARMTLSGQVVYEDVQTGFTTSGITKATSYAPSYTSLGSYYQLLVYESTARFIAVNKRVMGMREGPAGGDLEIGVNWSDTLLPIPVVSPLDPSKQAIAGVRRLIANQRRRGRSLQQYGTVRLPYAPTKLGDSPFTNRMVGPNALELVSYDAANSTIPESVPYVDFLYRPAAYPGMIPYRFITPVLRRNTAAGVGLRGNVTLSKSAGALANTTRFMRTTGFMLNPLGKRGMLRLRVRPGLNQSVLLNAGNVTLVSAGLESPSASVAAYEVDVMLPEGYMPMDVVVRTQATADAASFDVAILEPALVAGSVGGDLWYEYTQT